MTSPTLAATGQWSTTGDLPAARSWSGQHDGPVVLAGGKVLVAGGADGSAAPQSSAALYDPAAATWAATGALLTARRLHTLTLLADGRVLVTGGITGSGEFPPGVATAEIYDPTPGTWTPTGGLHTARWGHSAVLLADGRVLVAGGFTARSAQSLKALRSAEIFDPAAGTWTETAALTDARGGHRAITLGGGKVLVVGGSAPIGRELTAALAFCELYDPAAGQWTPTGSMLVPRSGHQATPLSDGTVLATGGDAPGGPGDGTFDPFSRATAELYKPAAGTWSALPDMPAGRSLHRAVSLGAKRALVVGGTDSPLNGGGYASALIFDAAGGGSWSPAGGLATGRWALAAAALADGRVLVTGGATRSGLAAADPALDELTADTEIFDAQPVIT
jgi:galactose oxidase-like protein